MLLRRLTFGTASSTRCTDPLRHAKEMTSNEIEIGPIHRGARISVRKTTDGARLDKVYHHPAMTLSPHRSPVTVTTIADIFDLPERVHQGDFVLRLAEGVGAGQSRRWATTW